MKCGAYTIYCNQERMLSCCNVFSIYCRVSPGIPLFSHSVYNTYKNVFLYVIICQGGFGGGRGGEGAAPRVFLSFLKSFCYRIFSILQSIAFFLILLKSVFEAITFGPKCSQNSVSSTNVNYSSEGGRGGLP